MLSSYIAFIVSYLLKVHYRKKNKLYIIQKAIEEYAIKWHIDGYCVKISGTLKASARSRLTWIKEGKLGISTLDTNVSYSFATSHTPFGSFGIKVWVSVPMPFSLEI